ncbi:hypothetical protein CTEN210_12340 [Chaetoceros tenuissimus]|uniref:G-protein coupled receptors family 1 profile domain-containing protein n=1 Tax=Chaetoceros tenuissimus TaxID=426638 RepID=A0AAD3HAD7_9STRA|nr:hypothetical protein CTEN210_12340 [Chaetoceros tenuissimus]
MVFSASVKGAVITRSVMGGISTVSSSLLLFFIYFAPTGLKSPYSRIIFGLSLADVLQSLGMLLGAFAAPDAPFHIYGRGNVQSCEAIGFFTIIGFLAVPWYTLHLTYYFLKRVKYRVKPGEFANGQEKWLHIIIWTYAFAVAIYALAKGQINASKGGSMCVVADRPAGCEKTPDQECVRGEGANTTIVFTGIATLVTVFIALFLVLGAFTLHVYFSEKQLQPSKRKLTSLRRNNNHDEVEEEEKSNEGLQEVLSPLGQDNDPEIIASSVERSLRDYHDKEGFEHNDCSNDEEEEINVLSKYEQQALDLVLTKAAVVQSSLYIFAFMLVYSGPIITLILGYTQSQVVFWFVSVFYPLGGMFNMIIYTRPKVQAVKKSIPRMPRIICFVIVLMSGGETPNLMDIMASQEQNIREQQLSARSAAKYTSRLAHSFGFPENADLEVEIERAMREIAIQASAARAERS